MKEFFFSFTTLYLQRQTSVRTMHTAICISKIPFFPQKTSVCKYLTSDIAKDTENVCALEQFTELRRPDIYQAAQASGFYKVTAADIRE